VRCREDSPADRQESELSHQLQEHKVEATGVATLGHTTILFHWDWTAADRAFRRALELDPGSADAHGYYSAYLAWMGRFEEAIAQAQEMLAVAPLDVGAHWVMAWACHKVARHHEAIREFQRAHSQPSPTWRA
jgi:serine/threonine-protein kinase